jgi:glycosyltransferase involved in cell wall biosynthesis
MLTWEFPPRIIGGISTHVYHLSRALVEKDTLIRVITCDFPKAPAEEVVDGVLVSRVTSGQVPQTNFHLWVYHLNSQLIERGKEILEEEMFDVLHAHDWLVGRAAIELKAHYDLPLVTTIHATEMGRGGALEDSYRKKIHATERLLTKNSERVICCSNYMVHHVQDVLGVPANRIHVIPNGVDPARFDGRSSENVQTSFGPGDERTILFVGRLVKEKGVSTLLEAIKDLSSQGSQVNLRIVGDGPMREQLAREALGLGLDGNVRFTGFVDSHTLVSLYRSSDVCVVPSLHEPFGLVALEAMAAGTPAVVSDVGGLSEIVEDGVTGIKVPPGDGRLLAIALRRVLEDRSLAEQLRRNGNRHVRDCYGWAPIAETTLSVYELARAQQRVPVFPVSDEELLGDEDLLHYLHAVGATDEEVARSAREIASALGAPEFPVKLILGRQVSCGYVSTVLEDELSNVRYHLSATGVIKVCSDFS